jgi:hypothetical protein
MDELPVQPVPLAKAIKSVDMMISAPYAYVILLLTGELSWIDDFVLCNIGWGPSISACALYLSRLAR